MDYLMNDIYHDEEFMDMMLNQERQRRIQFEGPTTEPIRTITEITGNKYNIHDNGKCWTKNTPCTSCDENECLNYLIELSNRNPVKYIYGDTTSICNNPHNNGLLSVLCAWRKHIKTTNIVELPFGSEKWKRYSICTSELTFLGRRTELGGILGIVSLTTKHIHSLASLVSLMEKEAGIHNGVKCLSAGFAMLITMYMNWDIYTQENATIIAKLLKKVRKNRVVGLDTYAGTPWYAMFKAVLERRRIPDTLQEFILSRAHLP
jgi:hypothetical protein